MKQTLVLFGLCTLVAACSGRESYTSSAPWKETDKHLSCDQLLLEMNDAKFWNQAAANNRKMGFWDVVNPVGYMSTRDSADQAIGATQERLRYLNNVYEIKGCAKPYSDTPIPAPNVRGY